MSRAFVCLILLRDPSLVMCIRECLGCPYAAISHDDLRSKPTEGYKEMLERMSHLFMPRWQVAIWNRPISVARFRDEPK